MIRFHVEAAAAVRTLYDDPTRQTLADRVHAALAAFDRSPGDVAHRRRRFGSPGGTAWLFSVYGNGEAWAVVWGPREDGSPFVYFVGPSSLA